jgi:hypothetical protein
MTHKELALADDAGSLAAAHPVNVAMAGQGHGSAARVVSVNPAERSALVAINAIRATVKVPFGWHVVEDEHRTLVFDGETRVQLSLNVLEAADMTPADLVESLLVEVRGEHPAAEFCRLELDGAAAAALRGFEVDGEPVEQAFAFRPVPSAAGGANRFLMARVTAAPADFPRGLDLAELVLRHLQFTA